VFITREALVAQDTDGGCYTYGREDLPCPDVYELYRGRYTLLSTGPGDINDECGSGRYDTTCVRIVGVSDDARRVLFSTGQRLVPGDTDNAVDIYLSRAIPHQCRDKNGKEPKNCGD
jgi:hypothetical protein